MIKNDIILTSHTDQPPATCQSDPCNYHSIPPPTKSTFPQQSSLTLQFACGARTGVYLR